MKYRILLILLCSAVFCVLSGTNTESSALGKRVITKEEQEIRSIAARDVEAALKAVKDLIATKPDDDELVRLKGDLLLKADRPDDAMEAYRSALEMNPKSKTAMIGVGKTQMAKGELKEAEATLLGALSLNPNPAYAHYELGRLYELMKNFDKAIEHYQQGIESLGFKAGCTIK